jgi:chromosome segregation ATPase
LTLIIAAVVSVGVSAALNNGNLMFASTNQAAVLAAEIDQLETSIQTVQSDLDSLRGRVDNLEALGDRVGELETSVESFEAELVTTTTLVEDLNQRVGDIETEITQVKGSVERFQVFFEGLRQLLTNVFTTEETDQ